MIWSDFGNGTMPLNVIIDESGVVRYSAIGLNQITVGELLDDLMGLTSIDGHLIHPDQYLIQNYPNPFNGRTRINFTTTQTGAVTLRIIDAAGKTVRTLIQDPMHVGAHGITWNARDDQGNHLPSGIYFAMLTDHQTTISQKLMLLK